MSKKKTTTKNRDNTAFLYLRLSRDDKLDGESYSITNQKKLLTKAAKEMGFTNLVTFTDDGISGVTMNRPGYIEMMAELEQGHAAAVFVKDLSRLGRNYIEVGKLMEEFFPTHDIRLVAISDGIDTQEGENELAPIRNLFNEWYARDISKKRRISNKVRGNSGEPLGPPPYGYQKDPDDPKRWIIDEEAAQVVRTIFTWYLAGRGVEQIATQLDHDGVLIPTAYLKTKGINRPTKHVAVSPTHWNSATIVKMLANQEYCGDVINFKTYSKSYKLKTRYANDPDKMAIFKDVHEPIIQRADWEQVQEKRNSLRKRETYDGDVGLFSGLLTCADCGCNMHFHFNQGNREIRYYNCSNYKGNRGSCTSTHYVRVDFLEQVILGEIRRMTKFATAYEDQFAEAVMQHSIRAQAIELRELQKSLASLQARDQELDKLFERIYEDNVSGKLTDERFTRMSQNYDAEQKALAAKIKETKAAIDSLRSKTFTKEMFLSAVRKYTRAKKLSREMLNALIDHIDVHQAEKINGVWEQRLTIHYNGVGAVVIPETVPLPAPDVTVNTRRGVFVSYTT